MAMFRRQVSLRVTARELNFHIKTKGNNHLIPKEKRSLSNLHIKPKSRRSYANSEIAPDAIA